MIVLSFKLISDALPTDGVRVVSLVGEEELTRPFRYEVTLAFSPETPLPELAADLFGQPATIVFLQDGEELRRVTGIVTEAHRFFSADVGDDVNAGLSLVLSPRMSLLSEFRTTELFLDASIPAVIEARLQSVGLRPDDDYSLSLSRTYARREIVVQHEEDGLSFVNRLCEHWGITYFFRQQDGKDVLVLCDHNGVFERFDKGDGRVSFTRQGGDPLGVSAHTTSMRRVPKQVVVADYNYRVPHLGLVAAKSTDDDATEGEIFSYGVHAKSPAEIADLARIRAERVEVERLRVQGTSRKMQFRPGSTFVFDDDAAENDLLLTKVVHHATRAGGDSEPTYRNSFEAIPSSTPYRPAQLTQQPRISGLVHGVVDGAIKGAYAELDGEGRYRVRFRHDRSGRTDLSASHPVRLMQTHAGPDYGMHFPLRPGTEVLVGFVEGDPDRPVIVGCAPNPLIRTPVDSNNHTENVLRSQGRNELVMDDLDGQQRIRLATPTENTVFQLGSPDEPESGALLRTNASATNVAGRAITDASPLRTTLANDVTTLAARNVVHLAGLTPLGGPIGEAAHDHDRLDKSASNVLGALSALGAFPAPSEPGPADAGGATKTFSGLAQALSGRANKEAEAAVRRMATRTRKMSLNSQAIGKGQPPGTSDGPHAIFGSSKASTVFAREELLLFADRLASLSSDEVTRIVAGQQLELHSPEEAEIAARRAVQVTSASYVDVEGDQIYIRGGGDIEEEDFPADDISIGIVANRTLRLKSANGAFIACADQKLVLNSHEGSASLTAKGDVHISGASIHGFAGAIGLSAKHNITIDTKEDVLVTADGNVAVKPKSDFFVDATVNIVLKAGAEVIVKAPKVTIDGDVEILGSLKVSGDIKSG